MRGNQTMVTEFILEGFPRVWLVEVFLFVLFLLTYIVTIVGNLFVVGLVCTTVLFRSPMYFFLLNYSLIQLALSFVVTPKVLSILLSARKSISYAGCLTQSYFFFLISAADLILLAVMSYDRYVAVCYPLHYITIMSRKRCIILVVGSWLGGILAINIAAVLKGDAPYCGPNKINHFFCDTVPLTELICMDTRVFKMIDFLLFAVVILGTGFVITFTYTYILLAVIRIPSANGRKKVFSTCSSHFSIMIFAYVSAIFMYVLPRDRNLLELHKALSVIDIQIIPVTLPFVYSLRNAQMKSAMFNSFKRVKA